MITITLTLTSLLLAPTFAYCAAVIVHDPALADIAVRHNREEISKLETITEEIQATNDRLGNAGEILDLAGWSEVATSLETTGVGRSRVKIAISATSANGVVYDGDGVFVPVGKSFVSRDGTTIARPDVFKPEAAIFNAVQDHDAVYEDVMTRRETLKFGMQQTLYQLQAATTHAEVLKTIGVLVAQHAELDAVDRELIFAAQKVVLLDIQNRGDKERQEKACAQEQGREFSEALRLFCDAMRPPTFPPPPLPPPSKPASDDGSGRATDLGIAPTP